MTSLPILYCQVYVSPVGINNLFNSLSEFIMSCVCVGVCGGEYHGLNQQIVKSMTITIIKYKVFKYYKRVFLIK